MTDALAWTCRVCGGEIDDGYEYFHECTGSHPWRRFTLWLDTKCWLLAYRLRHLRCRLRDHRFVAYPHIVSDYYIKAGRTCSRCHCTFYDPPIALEGIDK